MRRAIGSARGEIVWVEYGEPVMGQAVMLQPVLDTPTGRSLLGMVEWGSRPVQYRGLIDQPIGLGVLYDGERRFIAVSWLLPASVGAVSLALILLPPLLRRQGHRGFSVLLSARR
jgi:hypothetical protein